MLLGGATTAAALGACGIPTGQESEGAAGEGVPQRGGTLRVAVSDAITTFDPALPTTVADIWVAMSTYEPLVWRKENGEIQPLLATTWDVSDDLLTWTFTLRQGVTFHHGTPFTSEDVVYTFERIRNPSLGSAVARNISFVDRIEAIDPFTVRFFLLRPFVDMLYILASFGMVIVPHDRDDTQLATAAAGTGPFRQGEYLPGEQISLARNPEYWQSGLPYLDNLRFIFMPESVTQSAALTSGTIDALPDVVFDTISSLEKSPDVQVFEVPSGSFEHISMQMQTSPFNDIRVRQALKHCVNRQGMIQAVLQGRGEIGNDQPIGPNSSFWANIPPATYDVEQARQLLTEAGYPDGLDLTLYTSNAAPGMLELSVAFQEMARAAGVTITIERVPAESYWTEYYMRVPFFTSYGTTPGSLDTLLGLLIHSEGPFNDTGWQDDELDALIEAAQSEPDQNKRKEFYTQIQQRVADEGGYIIPYFRSTVSAIRKNVQDFVPPHAWDLRFDKVWLEQS